MANYLGLPRIQSHAKCQKNENQARHKFNDQTVLGRDHRRINMASAYGEFSIPVGALFKAKPANAPPNICPPMYSTMRGKEIMRAKKVSRVIVGLIWSPLEGEKVQIKSGGIGDAPK